MNKINGVLGGGFLLFAIGAGLGFFGVPYALKWQIRKASRIDPGEQLYNMWVEAPSDIDVFLKFTFFNVTNGDAIIENTAKPKVSELGPYVFKERRVKVDIQPGTTNGSIQYRQKLFITYVPELSKGSLSDKLTFLNFPLVGVGKLAMSLTKEASVHEMLEDMLIYGKDEYLFKTHTVGEVLLDGFSIQNFVDLLKDPAIALLGDVPPLPPLMEDGMIALYEGKNGSDDGLYEIDTGHGDPLMFGKVRKWNGSPELPWWKDPKCREIKGTDGTIFPPFLNKEETLYAYQAEICRALYINFEKEVVVDGLNLWRFTPPSKAFGGPKTNPENECFCLEEDKSFCDRNGFMMMGGCADGAPVMLSNAHFYDADPKYAEAIDGINPDKEKHQTYLDIEPMTAGTVRAAKRLQMNFEVTAWPTIPYFAKLGKNITFPIFWAEESATLPPKYINIFKMLYKVIDVVDIGKWILSLAGIALVALGIYLRHKQPQSNVEKIINPEKE